MKIVLITISFFAALIANSQTTNADTLKATKTDSVTVISKKPVIQTLIDKTVINVENRLTAAGQNALDLLRSAPGVVVDGNENIQMGGKNGVTVLIDGRNTNLSNQDLAQVLKSIEATNIKEIELITNPSAKFDAAGNAGIINIKLKKSITNGFNGNIGVTHTQSTHARNNVTTTLNFRKNKINIFGNVNLNKGYQNTIANNDRITPVKQYTQRSNEGDAFNGSTIRTGLDYNINKKNTVGFLWMNNFNQTTMDNNSHTLLQQVNNADTNVITRSEAPFNNNRNNFNLNYGFNGIKETITFDADYTQFASSLYNTVRNEMSNQSYIKYANNASQNNATVAIKIASLKVDYSKKLKGNLNIESGIKLVTTNTNNYLRVLHATNANFVLDTGKTNQFNYQEKVHAAYLNLNKELKKFTIQLGLRAEQTRVNGSSINLKNEQNNNPDTVYINLFPTVFLQYTINEQHQIGINYGKRIDRPSYQDQNPFIYVLDAFNSEVGNPYLQPQITHGIELSYTYKYAASAKLKYATTTNYIEQLTYQNSGNTILTPQNAGTRRMLNLSLSTPLQPTKWWSSYISAEPFWQQYNTIINGYNLTTTTTQSSIGFNGYLGNWFTFKNNWKAEISGWFNYQNTTTIYKSKPIGSINIGASKNCFNNKLTVRCSINDLFNTQRWQQTVNTAQLNMLTYRKWESRNISFSCTYRFGNNKIKAARERVIGTETELDRIKSK